MDAHSFAASTTFWDSFPSTFTRVRWQGDGDGSRDDQEALRLRLNGRVRWPDDSNGDGDNDEPLYEGQAG